MAWSLSKPDAGEFKLSLFSGYMLSSILLIKKRGRTLPLFR